MSKIRFVLQIVCLCVLLSGCVDHRGWVYQADPGSACQASPDGTGKVYPGIAYARHGTGSVHVSISV